jgi:hypothetical protein
VIVLYTFDANKLLKLLLLQNIGKIFFIILRIYLLGQFLLHVSLFYLLRPLDNFLKLFILSGIENSYWPWGIGDWGLDVTRHHFITLFTSSQSED